MTTPSENLPPPPIYKRDPNIKDHPKLAEKRYNQWRRFSRDPYRLPVDIEPPAGTARQEPGKKSDLTDNNEPQTEEVYRRLKFPGSEWTLLFYDLAWTATFATLSQNGKYTEPMDAVSYFAFFAAVLWLWASQTLYSVHFYTNDWFHLTSIFFQLLIFGVLAATTKGYDITAYISHSPGATDLSPHTTDLSDEERLQRVAMERTDLLSTRAMALVFAITRFLSLIQYLRVCLYARWGRGAKERKFKHWGRFIFDFVHPQIYAIIVGLIFSNMIFFAVVGIVFSDFGITRAGALLKIGLWVMGFLLEVISHIWYSTIRRVKFFHVRALDNRSKDESTLEDANARKGPKTITDANTSVGVNPLPLSGVNLALRLDTITTIILGEGINGFAGTLTSILTAPGVGRAVAVNATSTAFIVWFIVYLYVEGPTSGLTPKGEGLRRMLWMVTYLPLLASIFLLFVGMKNQFLLTSTLSAVQNTFDELNHLLNQQGFLSNSLSPELESNNAIKEFLFARGINWSKEYRKLLEAVASSTNHTSGENLNIWELQLSLIIVVTGYEGNFQWKRRYIGDSTIIDRQLFEQIIHRIPDRYQWSVVTSRFVMGIVLALLLFLNLGRYQHFFVPLQMISQRAGVFLWLEAFWVLPTIAIAYGVQFLIEIVLSYFARRATLKAKDNDNEKGIKDKVKDKGGDEDEVEAEAETQTQTGNGMKVLSQSLSYSAPGHRSSDQVV